MLKTKILFILSALSLGVVSGCVSKKPQIDANIYGPLEPWTQALPAEHTAYLIPEDVYRSPTRKMISRQNALAEIEWLETLLEEAYAGWNFAEKDWPESWSQRFESLKKTLEADELPIEQYGSSLANIFFGIRDQHLRLWEKSSDGSQKNYFEASKKWAVGDDGSCADIEERISAKMWEPEGIQPLKVAFTSDVACGTRLDRRSRILPYQVILKRTPSYVYLRLPSLYDPDIVSAFKNTAAEIKSSDTLVLDVRENGGGTPEPFLEWWYQIGGPELETLKGEQRVNSVVVQAMLNRQTELLSGDRLTEKERKDLLQRRLDWARELSGADEIPLRGKKTREFQIDFRRQGEPTFTGAIILLVDRFCASACEEVLAFLRQYPKTTVVGSQTGGMLLFIMNDVRVLPHSRLRLTFARGTYPSLESESEFQEGRGYLPQLWLPPGLIIDSVLEKLVDDLVKE